MSTNAPASTYVLVVSLITAFSSFWMVLTFLPPWYWYLIPAACAVPGLVVLAMRWAQRRALRAEIRASLEELG